MTTSAFSSIIHSATSFGFLDGISNPAVIGFDKNPPPGPAPVRAGAILLGHPGDENQENREPWMVDGSFLVFRYLFQHVPEFDKFIEDNAIKMPGLSKEEGKELLGARLVGRWKSGMLNLVTLEIEFTKANT